MCPTHTRKRGKLYRYYISQTVLKHGTEACPVRRVPAADVERAVVDQVRKLLRSPEIVVATWRRAREEIDELKESHVRHALGQFDDLWTELFPVEQARIVRLVVERVDVQSDGLDIGLNVDGLSRLAAELVAKPKRVAA
jgi:hypothetical protein